MKIPDDKQVPGQFICLLGRGTAGGMHLHTSIERLTRTQLVLKGSNHRLLRSDGTVYGTNGGGYHWYETGITCQKRKASA